MIVTIHQPEYLPWLGFFDRIIASDVFVILDHVQYQKHGFINRNRIKTANGEMWLTVPVDKKMKLDSIREVEIKNVEKWQEKHFKSISQSYSKAPYFSMYKHIFDEIFSTSWCHISQLNIHIITQILNALGVKKEIYKSSELDVKGESDEMLINICEKLNAETYLCGQGGKLYMDLEHYQKADINVVFREFDHPTYNQLYTGSVGFLPYMSIIDLLFNHGEESLKIIQHQV